MLAYLILHPGMAVPVDRLVSDLAGDAPPGRARATITTQLAGLQSVLGAERLAEVDRGYRLQLDRCELDAELFRDEVEAGRSAYAESDIATAAAVLTRALDRWRGPALADVADTLWAAPSARRLESLRREAEAMLRDPRLLSDRTAEVPRVVARGRSRSLHRHRLRCDRGWSPRVPCPPAS